MGFLIAQAVREFVEREYASLVAVREGAEDRSGPPSTGRHLAASELSM